MVLPILLQSVKFICDVVLITFGISIFINVIILFEDIKEKWVKKAFLLYFLAFILLHYIEFLLSWNLLFFYPMPAIYLLLHNVTILSYGILKLR